VEGDRLYLFNDPNCPEVTGIYRWRIQERRLVLTTVSDSCSIKLRAANLSSMPWDSCYPPNTEAAVTDHWLKPAGCD
jgi:hypothetical protein